MQHSHTCLCSPLPPEDRAHKPAEIYKPTRGWAGAQMPVYRILILGVDPLRVIETTIRCHEAHPSPNSPGVPKYGAQSLVPTREALDRTDFDAILVQTDKNGGMVPSSEPGVTRLHFARVDLSCPREGKSHRRRSERDFVARVVRTRRVNQFRRAFAYHSTDAHEWTGLTRG